MAPFRSILAAALVVGASASGAAIARGDTWIVDDDGPGNFKDVTTAAAAAADGDTLLVRPGRYGTVELVRKGLRIIGNGPGEVVFERTAGEGPCIRASDLVARQTLILSGIYVIGRGATIEISRCGGLVVLSDLVVESRHPTRAGAGPVLKNCTHAFLTRVAVIPGEQPSAGGATGLSLESGNYTVTQVVALGSPGVPGHSPFGRGGTGDVGLAVADAKVFAALCEFVGGTGGAADWDARAPGCPEAATAGAGGSGLYVRGLCEVVFAGDGHGQMRGGDGGAATKNPWDNCWSYGGAGGSAVRIAADDATKRIILSQLPTLAGAGGAAEGRRGGAAGPEIDGAVETITREGPLVPTLALEEPGVYGGRFRLRVRGTPGDSVTLVLSTELGHLRLKAMTGFPLQAIPGGIWLLLPRGRLGEDGLYTIDAKLPELRDTIGRTIALQALVIPPPDSDRPTMLSNVDLLTIADGGNAPQPSH